jgi:hypothetical protein
MFSHTINNPNNFVIETDYHIIPSGSKCCSALACKFANLRKFSLPFDWSIPVFPAKIQKVLENNFDDFIPDVRNRKFKNKYGIGISHFNPNIDMGIEEYKRRIIRFNDIINQPKKIYFVYINEEYLYNRSYRTDKFNEVIFNQMLEFEKFIKNKYTNINYNILYFNFIQHNIPAHSNIINIVLQTDKLYTVTQESPYNEFRIYCGKILAELFNTNIEQTIDYNINIYKN